MLKILLYIFSIFSILIDAKFTMIEQTIIKTTASLRLRF